MPKVSNIQVKIDGKHQKMDVYYSKSEGFHLKTFPDSVLRAIQQDTWRAMSGFDTEKELEDHVNKNIREYHDRVKTSRKMIRFRLHATTKIRMNQTSPSSYSGNRPGISNEVGDLGSGFNNNEDSCDYGIGFDFEVVLETEHNGKHYSTVERNGEIGHKTHIGRSDTIIEWTPEREASFYALADGMYNLMVKICDALGDKEKAIAFIDSKIKLLK